MLLWQIPGWWTAFLRVSLLQICVCDQLLKHQHQAGAGASTWPRYHPRARFDAHGRRRFSSCGKSSLYSLCTLRQIINSKKFNCFRCFEIRQKQKAGLSRIISFIEISFYNLLTSCQSSSRDWINIVAIYTDIHERLLKEISNSQTAPCSKDFLCKWLTEFCLEPVTSWTCPECFELCAECEDLQ